MTTLTARTLKGFVPAIVTPFDRSGAIVEEAFLAILDHLVEIGAQGLCIAGDNGESWNLSVEERGRLTRIAVDRVRGRIPVMTGATAPSAKQTILYAKAAKEAGADGILLMPQTSVMKATRDELMGRFEAVGNAVDLPIVLYNSPRRAVIELSIDDVDALTGIAPIVGIKESNRDIGHLTRLIRRLSDRIAVMVGPAYYILAGAALGASGFIATGPELLGPLAGRLMEIGRSAPSAEYRDAHYKLTVLYETLMAVGTWPSSLKAGLTLIGLPAGLPRDPLLPLEGAGLERLRSTLGELGLLPA